MKKFNNFKDSKAVSLDFTKIENEVSENIDSATKAKQKKYVGLKLNKVWRYALCIMLTCVVSVGSTLLISGSMKDDSKRVNGFGSGENIDPGKSHWIINENFDSFFAFNGWYSENCLDSEYSIPFDPLATDIISEKDKSTVKEFELAHGKTGEDAYYYNIYMGMKDGKDIVVLHRLIEPYEVFTFDSNLEYSFSSVIEKFEELSGEKLTSDFLLNRDWDADIWYDLSGITIRFILNKKEYNQTLKQKKSYFEYYHALINGQLYIVSGKQLLS